jgi:hypothetical protein
LNVASKENKLGSKFVAESNKKQKLAQEVWLLAKTGTLIMMESNIKSQQKFILRHNVFTQVEAVVCDLKSNVVEI